MASNLGRIGTDGVPSPELDREYRVLRQTLSMHSMLRDRYAGRALALDLVLLGAGLVFAVTTFASDEVLQLLGADRVNVRSLLGVASVAALFGAIVGLRVDWKGKSALHREAVRSLTELLGRFRTARRQGGMWDSTSIDDLLRRYWEVANTVVAVPEKDFAALKSRHLRKVALSKLIDEMPGAPVWLLDLRIRFASIRVSLTHSNRNAPHDE